MIQNYSCNILKLTQYNLWANRRISELVEEWDEEKFSREINSSFPSIKKTVLHIWDAQVIWTLRLYGKIIYSWPSKNFKGTKEELLTGFIHSSKELEEYVNTLKTDEEKAIIEYSNLKGEKFSTSISDIIIHCINHSTFHRGQIITMLRQTGKTELISTDYIIFLRE
jgi:uncharacterized damage-inducible protein DinB